MQPAVDRFAAEVNATQFAVPQFDVVSNVDAKPYRDVETIKHNLVRSITEEVLWHDTAQALIAYDLDSIVEFGASAVLAPLMKRLPGVPSVLNVSDYLGVQKLREMLAQPEARISGGSA